MSIHERTLNVIAEYFGIDEGHIADDTTLEDLGADSLDSVELMGDLEEEFDVIFNTDSLTSQTTVAQVVQQIEEKLS